MPGLDDNSDLKDALPDAPQGNGAQTAGAATEQQKAPQAYWGEKTANNYDEDQDVEWDGNVQVYEWDGEEGDLGPEHPDLETQLFGNPQTRDAQGVDFDK